VTAPGYDRLSVARKEGSAKEKGREATMPSRFDHFPKFELDILWQSLYDHRQKLIDRDGASYNFEADDTSKLIDEIYLAPNWRDRPVRNV
jgi:hypothetical protein